MIPRKKEIKEEIKERRKQGRRQGRTEGIKKYRTNKSKITILRSKEGKKVQRKEGIYDRTAGVGIRRRKQKDRRGRSKEDGRLKYRRKEDKNKFSFTLVWSNSINTLFSKQKHDCIAVHTYTFQSWKISV